MDFGPIQGPSFLTTLLNHRRENLVVDCLDFGELCEAAQLAQFQSSSNTSDSDGQPAQARLPSVEEGTAEVFFRIVHTAVARHKVAVKGSLFGTDIAIQVDSHIGLAVPERANCVHPQP